MPSFLIQTLGCKLNQLESEAIADAYTREGFEEFLPARLCTQAGERVKFNMLHSESPNKNNNFNYCFRAKPHEPSVVIINTCTVTSKADQKARRVIRKALRDYPDAKVIVTGCYAQLNKDDILKLETDGKGRLCVVSKDKIINQERNDLFQFNPKSFSSHTRSFLKIQDGCDKHCTYCKIRLARGKSVSLDAEEVLKRLRVLEETHAEAVITGVNICQYRDQVAGSRYHGLGNREQVAGNRCFGLAELMEFLLKGTSKIAIRLSSLAPESVDEKLIKVLAHPRIRPHFHLSIQSCSDKILERMGRVYNAQTVEGAVNLLRGTKEDPFLACDIITGFPGETEAEFLETFSICKKLDFAWIHVFPFSKREGTPAFSFKDSVAESEVTHRVEMLTELAKQGRAAYVKRWLGKEVDVLVEKKKKTFCNGVSENYLKVLLRCEGNALPAGTVVRCRLMEAGDLEDYDAVADTV